MKYNGVELVKITEPQIFDPPQKMVVWDSQCSKVEERVVSAVVKDAKGDTWAVAIPGFVGGILEYWAYCAKVPEELKPRRATWKELAYWLMDGKGLVVDESTSRVDTGVFFNRVDLDAEVSDTLKVMRRDDTDWHEPDVKYMGLV